MTLSRHSYCQEDDSGRRRGFSRQEFTPSGGLYRQENNSQIAPCRCPSSAALLQRFQHINQVLEPTSIPGHVNATSGQPPSWVLVLHAHHGAPGVAELNSYTQRERRQGQKHHQMYCFWSLFHLMMSLMGSDSAKKPRACISWELYISNPWHAWNFFTSKALWLT